MAFYYIFTWACAQITILRQFLDEKVTCISFFSFYLFAAVIDLLLDLLPVQKLPQKHHQDRQILPWNSHVKWQGILLEFFTQILNIFEHISGFIGYHWKDHFLLQKLSIDDANFNQRWWCQKWNKGQGSSWPVMRALGVNGLNGHPKIKFVLEKAMTDKSQKLKVIRDKNILWSDSMFTKKLTRWWRYSR